MKMDKHSAHVVGYMPKYDVSTSLAYAWNAPLGVIQRRFAALVAALAVVPTSTPEDTFANIQRIVGDMYEVGLWTGTSVVKVEVQELKEDSDEREEVVVYLLPEGNDMNHTLMNTMNKERQQALLLRRQPPWVMQQRSVLWTSTSHCGDWRGCDGMWCNGSAESSEDGAVCRHPPQPFAPPHWSCCGSADQNSTECIETSPKP